MLFEDNENNLDSLFGASVSEMLHSAELIDSFNININIEMEGEIE